MKPDKKKKSFQADLSKRREMNCVGGDRGKALKEHNTRGNRHTVILSLQTGKTLGWSKGNVGWKTTTNKKYQLDQPDVNCTKKKKGLAENPTARA